MPSGMNYTDAAVVAPGPNTDASYVFFKALFDYMFLRFNLHVTGGLTADKHGLSQIDAAVDGNRPLVTVRSITSTTGLAESDMFRRMWLELVDADFVPTNFAGKAVPITLLTARNNIRGGLGSGNGLGVPGTDAPNVNPNTIPWRGPSGYIPMVIGAIPRSAIQELAVIAASPPASSVFIVAGSYIEQGTGITRFYSGGTIATLAAPGGVLERFDTVYLSVSPAGAVVANIAQGVAGAVGTAGLPTLPDAACHLADIYMSGAISAVSNQANIAGDFAPITASYIQDARHLRAGGTLPDASLPMVKIKEFAPRPTIPPSLTVNALGGGFFNGSNVPLKYAGSSFTYNGAANAALLSGTNPSLPAAGFARFDGISVDLATALLIVTPGVPSNSGAETEPALPLTSRPVGYVHVTSTTTAIYANFTAMALATGGSTQGWIDDSYRVGAGGGGAGSTNAVAKPSNVFNNNDATYQDGFLGSSPIVTPNLPNFIQPTGSSVQIIATQANPVKLSFNGAERRYPNPTDINPNYLSTTAIGTGSANASGAAGYRYLVADISTVGVKTFGITIMTSLPNSPTQALLATLWWDGISSLVTVPDVGALISVDSALVNKRGAQVRWTGQSGLNSPGVVAFPTTMPVSAPFIVPPNARVKFTVRVRGTYHAGATPAGATFFSWVYLDSATQVTGTQIDSLPLLADSPIRETVVDDVLSGPSGLSTPGSISNAITPGQHTLTWGYLVQGTGTFDASYVQILAEVFRAGGY